MNLSKIMTMVGLFTLTSAHAFAATPILHYSYAMQAHGSELVIYDDGTVEHKERLGYRTNPVVEVSLGATDLAQLKVLIEASVQVPLQASQPVLDHYAAGNLYGSLEVKSNSSSEMILLRSYEMLFLNQEPYRKVQSRDSEATSKIILLISKYTQDDMPR